LRPRLLTADEEHDLYQKLRQVKNIERGGSLG